ncbi:tetratricopeptide repeat protein 9C [Solea senegalensis]|nr:tetratricopeptide repeat protein 9C [Solea senegalensis]KAG7517569.1 tetratricopeptide repeat protein 9C [Solea senegalensis]
MSSTAEMNAVTGEESSDAPVALAAGGEPPGILTHRQTSNPAWPLLEEAVKMKMEGNAFYREKNIRSAIGRYHRALLILRGLDSEVMTSLKQFGNGMPALTAEQEASLRSTQVDCYNNLAACLLQKESVDYARVQEYSLRVLHLRPGNVKALYRAGVACLEMGDAQAAKQYLAQACKAQPNDANVRKHLQRAEEKLQKEIQKEKALYRGMFSSREQVNQTNGDGD